MWGIKAVGERVGALLSRWLCVAVCLFAKAFQQMNAGCLHTHACPCTFTSRVCLCLQTKANMEALRDGSHNKKCPTFYIYICKLQRT